MEPAPLVGEAFFPLDEQLELPAGGLTPRAEETLVRLATWMPYAQAQERPQCATCGESLSARGEQTRSIQTTGGQAVKLTRTYGTCPACGGGFFPPR